MRVVERLKQQTGRDGRVEERQKEAKCALIPLFLFFLFSGGPCRPTTEMCDLLVLLGRTSKGKITTTSAQAKKKRLRRLHIFFLLSILLSTHFYVEHSFFSLKDNNRLHQQTSQEYSTLPYLHTDTMQITIKTLKQESFKVDVEESDKVYKNTQCHTASKHCLTKGQPLTCGLGGAEASATVLRECVMQQQRQQDARQVLRQHTDSITRWLISKTRCF